MNSSFSNSIIIPAHNEALRIGPMLSGYLEEFKHDSQLLIVLNGCTDNTAHVVNDIARGHPAVQVIDIKEPIGKGGAIREGFRLAHGQQVGFVDADGATSPVEFRRLLRRLGSQDGIIASRWIKGATVVNRTSPLRRIASRGFMAITKLLFHLPYRDTQCGAKIFQSTAIKKLLPNLRHHDMTFDVELLVLARHYGLRIVEEPTTWVDQSSSNILGSPFKLLATSWSMLLSLLSLFRRCQVEHLL